MSDTIDKTFRCGVCDVCDDGPSEEEGLCAVVVLQLRVEELETELVAAEAKSDPKGRWRLAERASCLLAAVLAELIEAR